MLGTSTIAMNQPQHMPGSQQGPLQGQNQQRGMMVQAPPGGAPYRPAAGPVAAVGPPPVLLQGKPDSRLVLVTAADSARAVSFRLLRDNLLAKRLPRVLAVSSAAKKDGKTTCALNLALSLSEGAKVLLLDGNLLEPELAKIFCIPDSTPPWPPVAPWLSPYRIVEFSRGLHVAGVVLAPGQVVPRFEKQWFEQLIGSLRRFPYDFIIIDAAALSVSPTVAQLVATADATLLAVRSGVTTARSLRRATDQIPEGKGIGIALIDATIRS
jgi:Mrp family chromosome partitioning ATPase